MKSTPSNASATQEQQNEMVRLYVAGASLREAAKAVGFSSSGACERALQLSGISPRKPGEWVRGKSRTLTAEQVANGVHTCCEQCGKTFAQKSPYRSQWKRFCSLLCRNSFIGAHQKRPAIKGIRCEKCHKIRYKTTSTLCLDCGGIPTNQGTRWTEEEVAFLYANYPHMGAAVVAEALGKTLVQVRSKANCLHIVLSEESRHKIVHSRARDFMATANPMKQEEAKQKVRDWRKANPEEVQRLNMALTEGHRRIERSNPSKLEHKLRLILEEFGVDFEPSYIVKENFIVDVRIGSLIIQADGDYWHGHPRFESLTPRQVAQQKRDAAQDAYLRKVGFMVVRIWECEMTKERVASVLRENGITFGKA